MKQNVRVAVIQAGSRLFDLQATLARFEQLTLEAARKGAELAVFPEAFIGGYPKGLDFGARVGQRSDTGREAFARYFRESIPVPGPETDQIGEVARGCDMHLVIGVLERDGATLYCSVLYFDANGTLVGKHRKLMPTAMERLVWGFGDGSTLDAVDTELGRIGALICWENYMPQARLAMFAQNVELYCAPTVDDRESWQPSMRHIAMEGRCYVLSACQYLTRDDCPADYFADSPDDENAFPEGVLIRGGSVIVSPMGNVLAGPVYDQEEILIAELDAESIIRGKFDFDIAGHYACPEIFKLQINTKALKPRN